MVHELQPCQHARGLRLERVSRAREVSNPRQADPTQLSFFRHTDLKHDSVCSSFTSLVYCTAKPSISAQNECRPRVVAVLSEPVFPAISCLVHLHNEFRK